MEDLMVEGEGTLGSISIVVLNERSAGKVLRDLVVNASQRCNTSRFTEEGHNLLVGSAIGQCGNKHCGTVVGDSVFLRLLRIVSRG